MSVLFLTYTSGPDLDDEIDSLHHLLMLEVFVLPMFLYQPIQSIRFAVEPFPMAELVFVK